MSSLRTLAVAARRAPAAFAVARRGYADAVTDKIKLSLVLPHQSIYTSTDVTQVNLAAETGDMGILANHVPSVEPLRAGVLEVIESSGSKKWFVSGGFATVHPGNQLTINVVEAAPLEDFSIEAIRSNLAEALKVAAGNGSEEDKLEARIEADVYESLQHALQSK